jgi:hypothetical protein
VEELEDRLPNQMEPILSLVRASLRDPQPTETPAAPVTEPIHVEEDRDGIWETEEDVLVDETMFDDTGEGAGVEGDLDKEED